MRSGASVAVSATDIRDPTIMNGERKSDHVQPADPVLDGEQDAYGQDDEPNPGGCRNETAKDERNEHDREADDASAGIASRGTRHVHPSGVRLSVGIAPHRSELE